jgi:hypothetical protein
MGFDGRRPSAMKMTNAQQAGYPLLYHYQSFNEAKLPFLIETLRDRTIHMSRPSAFNDPWDCRPWFDASELGDPAELEKYLTWMARNDEMTPDEIQRLRDNPEDLSSIVEVTHRFLLGTIDDTVRVYCLTPKPLHQLMWSHYGAAHSGIALEFDATTQQMQYAYRVDYSDTYPPLRMYEESEEAELVPIFTKSYVWTYEQEYRLVGEERRSALSKNRQEYRIPMIDKSTLRLEEGVLKGVVLGCKCDFDRAMAVLDEFAPDLRVQRAQLKTNRYELTLETVREALF